MKNLAEKIEKLNKDRIFQSFMERAELEEQDRLSQANLREERIQKEALEKGLAEGITRGLAEGRAEGMTEASIQIAINLKQMGIPLEKIMEATKLDKETIEKL